MTIQLISCGVSLNITNNDEKEDIGVKLKQGDTIKLGRIRYKVKEIHRGVYQPKEIYEEIQQTSIANTDVRILVKKKSMTPKMNNYIKHNTMMKQFKLESMRNRFKHNNLGSRANQILNSK